MEGNTLITSALFLSVGAGLMYWLKDLPKLAWKKLQTKFIYKVTIYDYDELYVVLENWLYKNHANKYRDTEAGYNILEKIGPSTPNNEQSGKIVVLQYKQGTDIFVIDYEGKKLLFSKAKEKLENASSFKHLHSHFFTIKGFKARKQIEDLLSSLTIEYNKSLEDNKLLFYGYYYGSWSLINKRAVKNIENIVIRKDLKEDLLQDLQNFLERKDWYERNNICYKRTYLFHGPPGTGKTTLAFSVAAQLKKNIFSINLNSIGSDEQLINAIKNVNNGSVLLMEDIDAAFVERKESDKTKLSFSCLLNCLDGALSRDDIVTVITTNHIERLDPALIRAGRIDRILEIQNGENEQVEEFLKLFYGNNRGFFIGDERISIPMSLVQEKCIQNMEDADKAISEILDYTNNINKRKRYEKVSI